MHDFKTHNYFDLQSGPKFSIALANTQKWSVQCEKDENAFD